MAAKQKKKTTSKPSKSTKSSKAMKECCDVAHDAGNKLREITQSVKGEARVAKARVIKEMRTKPVRSGLIAASVGLLAGLFIRRR